MKINEKILSLPPYISTSWSQISAIRMKGTYLSITLKDGDTIDVPGLDVEIIEKVFKAHAEFLEHQTQEQALRASTRQNNPFAQLGDPMNEPSFRFGFGTLDGFNAAMQHNPAQANAPDLPPSILQKISAISKIVAPEDQTLLPTAEPHCNCFHCQIARAINASIKGVQEDEATLKQTLIAVSPEEIVDDEELKFQQWDISQNAEKQFTVINRLDTLEKYHVYLGEPVGCTCGQPNCEHIIAVLKS